MAKRFGGGLDERAPLIVLLLSLFLTGVGAYLARENVLERDRLRFVLAIEDVEEQLRERVDSYLGLLWAVVGMFQANNLEVTDAQFRRFRVAAGWGGRNEGLAGLTFTQKVRTEDRAAFERKHQKRFPNFKVEPEPSATTGYFYSATHIEPREGAKVRALGYDPFTDLRRKQALDRATQSGRAAITSKVVLRSDSLAKSQKPAVLLYAPTYHPGAEIKPREERADLIYGFVGAGFYLDDFLGYLQRAIHDDEIGFQILVDREVLTQTGPPPSTPELKLTRKLEVAGATWTMVYWTNPGFATSANTYQVPIVILVGLLLSFTLYSLAVVQAKAKQARELALKFERQRAEDLEEQDRTKTRFFSSLNHELRTPLNGILGMSDLLYDTKLDETQKDYLTSIGSCARALSELINDVLDLSKISAGKMELRLAPLRVKDVFDQALQVVRGPSHGKNVKLKLEWDEQIPEWVELDGMRLRQILINLLGNAVKFTDQGQVILRTRYDVEQKILHFEVEDTGIGIDPEDIPKLFKPFSQLLQEHTSPEQPGTGLGLHLCRELCELMGGTISVTSAPAEGTTFHCRIPMAELEDNPYETQSMPNVSAHLAGSLSILVVDDNPINRRVLALQLEKLGQKVELAEGGEQACQAVSEGRFDLVLMDCQMPGVDGIQATRMIRESHPRQPFIVALTALAEESQRQECLSAGMNDFLTKPVEATRLQAVLARFSSQIERFE